MESGAESNGRRSFAALGTAGAYFLAAEFGARVLFPSAPVSVLWAPNAILLAALALSRPKHWWLYIAAVFVAHFAAQWFVFPPVRTITQFFANCGVALFGALALRMAGERALRFDRLRTAINLLVFGAILGPLVTSMMLAAVFAAFGLTDQFWVTVIVRTATNAFAVLTLVPVICIAVHMLRERRLHIDGRRALEALALAAAMVAVAAIVFVYAGGRSLALLYAPFPLLLVATVRFATVGVCGSMLLLAAVVGWGLPFVDQEPVESALSVVLFLLLNAMSLFLLAGVLGEQRAAVAATHESEAQRRHSDELYKAVLATCENCIAVLDSHGCIIELNETWRQRARDDPAIPPESRLGASYYDALNAWARGTDAAQISTALSDVLSVAGRRRRIEYSVTTAHGLRWIEQTIERLGRPEGGAVVVIADVTARKSAELDAQARYQELTHLARVAAVGGISGAIAHELNQPLSAIRGNAEAALRLLEQEQATPEDVKEILRDIVHNTGRASGVVQRVRALLRPGADPVRQPLNLSILVADVLRLVQNELVRRKVQLTADLPASLGLVEGDAIQIQQVVLNLVMNACEAMEQMAIKARRLVVTTRLGRSGNEVQVSVRDFGPGVTKEDRQRVFMPFVTSKAAGLGLGLFISRRIVEAHGGRLWCDPATPGTCFHVALPLCRGSSVGPRAN
jgi:two-component system, LuxR family, sensor kinase FixL